MRGTRFQETNVVQALQLQKVFDMHQRKLQQIRTESRKPLRSQRIYGSPSTHNTNNIPESNTFTKETALQSHISNETSPRVLSSRVHWYEYKEIEKLDQIRHENELLLRKLLKISQGKQLSVGHHLITNSQNRPRTLNFEVKKKEAEKIDNENQKLLQKINRIEATLPLNKINDDWRKLAPVRQRIQKSARLVDHTTIVKKRQEYLDKNFQVLPRILQKSSHLIEYSQTNETIQNTARSNRGGTTELNSIYGSATIQNKRSLQDVRMKGRTSTSYSKNNQQNSALVEMSEISESNNEGMPSDAFKEKQSYSKDVWREFKHQKNLSATMVMPLPKRQNLVDNKKYFHNIPVQKKIKKSEKPIEETDKTLVKFIYKSNESDKKNDEILAVSEPTVKQNVIQEVEEEYGMLSEEYNSRVLQQKVGEDSHIVSEINNETASFKQNVTSGSIKEEIRQVEEEFE